MRAAELSTATVLVGAALGTLVAGCAHYVAGQRIPPHVFQADLDDFDAQPGVAVLHYYGVGGWGIRWRNTYLLTAPYFSNHGYVASTFGKAVPDEAAIRDGFLGTPYSRASIILIGHGHVDHAADIPSYPLAAMGGGKPPALIADESTINLLGKETRDRVCAVPLHPQDAGRPIDGACSTGDVRIRPLPWQHAPHTRFLGVYLSATDPQGFQAMPRDEPPEVGNDWLVGRVWAYLIDLMQDGKPVFRILYVDAAANPFLAPPDPSASERPVDVHIACVPGFDLVAGYPAETIRRYDVRYVLGGHWEDFFQNRKARLKPVAVLDDRKMDAFVADVESTIGPPKLGAQPAHPSPCVTGETCGPHSDRWAIPVPGETFWFQTSAPHGGTESSVRTSY